MGKRRPLQEINAGSMADIAFLLLVFFLVTTTMDTDFGLQRKLPPPPEDNIEPPKFKQRNIFVVLANANDQLLVEGELLDITQLKEKAKEFISNPGNLDDLPEKEHITKAECEARIQEYNSIMAAGPNPAAKAKMKKWQQRLEAVNEVGDYYESKQVISLQNDRGTTYELYIMVQDQLAAAYSELRNDMAMEVFQKPFESLEAVQKDAISTVYPQRISEAEPKNIGG